MHDDQEKILDFYFAKLIKKVELSSLGNAGKEENGFFQPTRQFVIQKLNMLKDLNRNAVDNEHARGMLKSAWSYVVEHVPPEWLVLNEKEKAALKRILT